MPDIPQNITRTENTNTWLLSWNPKNWNAGGVGTSNFSLGLNTGDTVDWRCLSKQPKAGDVVYLIRLGVPPKGIVLKGVVTKETFTSLESDSSDADGKSRISIQITELRDTSNQGLLPSVLLKKAIPEQDWSPQSSGISIKPEAAYKLNRLWESGEGKNSLRQFVDWASADENFSQTDWLNDYQAYAAKTRHLKESGDGLDENLLQQIWKLPQNGIANVNPGPLSNMDYERNKEALNNLTMQILAKPDHDTYLGVLEAFENLKKQGLISKIYYAVINRVFAGLFPEKFTTIVSDTKCKQLLGTLISDFQLGDPLDADWYQTNLAIKQCMQDAGLAQEHLYKNNIAMWLLYTLTHETSPKVVNHVSEQDAVYETKNTNIGLPMMPLNQILYGPPGTGKTYHTITKALEILDPEYLSIHSEDRAELLARFNALKNEGRIGFVTFHQSFCYEDFVEGIKACTQNGQISYEVVNGIFKTMCRHTDKNLNDSLDAFDEAIRALVELCETEGRLTLSTVRGKPFAIEFSGGDTFRVFPESTENDNPNYVASIPNVKKLYLTGSKKGLYNISYVEGLLLFLKKKMGLPEYTPEETLDRSNEPCVFIIDEINRGNISSIFGELITLIEPSKRAGADEALSVTLPYSKEPFQVPNNLYIIGTMNTADRSLALMDSALRRRFDFVEMMPDVALLEGLEIYGIDVQAMLTTMNKRIEVLYDREHTLGHAFFMPLNDEPDEAKRFQLLQNIFANKVLPLLEEYFFEDWAKIRLVLGDDNKQAEHQLIAENGKDYDLKKLFGDALPDYGVEDRKSYYRNAKALTHPESYIGIYGK